MAGARNRDRREVAQLVHGARAAPCVPLDAAVCGGRFMVEDNVVAEKPLEGRAHLLHVGARRDHDLDALRGERGDEVLEGRGDGLRHRVVEGGLERGGKVLRGLCRGLLRLHDGEVLGKGALVVAAGEILRLDAFVERYLVKRRKEALRDVEQEPRSVHCGEVELDYDALLYAFCHNCLPSARGLSRRKPTVTWPCASCAAWAGRSRTTSCGKSPCAR